MKKILKNNWQIISLEILLLLVFIFFYGKFGDVMVDSLREAYIPEQMLSGKVLYKNIFCIYAPLSYEINAFLIWIFGSSLKVFYFAGLFASLGIFYFYQRIIEHFLSKNIALVICLFAFAGLVLSPNVFNSFFPYSYGLLYGLLFSLISIYCVLKNKLYLSYFFYSLAICCKYEFVLLIIPLLFYSRKSSWVKNILALIIPFFFISILLYIQGVRFEDLINVVSIIQTMGQTSTLHWFYSVMGVYFQWKYFPLCLENFINFLIPVNWSKYCQILLWIFPVVLTLFAFRFKKLLPMEKFIILVSVLISVKVFFAPVFGSYGAYFIPFALLAFFILIPHNIKRYFVFLLIVWTFITASINIKLLNNKSVKIQSEKGFIYTSPNKADGINEVLNYFKGVGKDKVIVAYPECLTINYMLDVNSDNKFYSLIPLYVETFGEDIISKRLDFQKPDYIVVSNDNMYLYKFSEFGVDYATNVMKKIENDYLLVKIFDTGMKFKIYARKN
ncbi:MAG: hypothetical protein E7Z89_03305 [Cyanobacteria bacterium SIG28]|nr:hypothetical protein [Cyanobacteria bacterium SIG28]